VIAATIIADAGARRLRPRRIREPFGVDTVTMDSLPFGAIPARPGLEPLFVPQPPLGGP
jgi:hypothetical protein